MLSEKSPFEAQQSPLKMNAKKPLPTQRPAAARRGRRAGGVEEAEKFGTFREISERDSRGGGKYLRLPFVPKW